ASPLLAGSTPAVAAARTLRGAGTRVPHESFALWGADGRWATARAPGRPIAHASRPARLPGALPVTTRVARARSRRTGWAVGGRQPGCLEHTPYSRAPAPGAGWEPTSHR